MPYRLDGVRVYAVKSSKSKNRHGRVNYPSRGAALKALARRGPRNHSRGLTIVPAVRGSKRVKVKMLTPAKRKQVIGY